MNPKLEEIVQRLKNLDRANLREFALVIQPISHTGFDVSNILNDLCDFFNDMDCEDGDFRVGQSWPEALTTDVAHEISGVTSFAPRYSRHYRYVCRKCGSTTRSIRANKRKCPNCGKKHLRLVEDES